MEKSNAGFLAYTSVSQPVFSLLSFGEKFLGKIFS